MSEATKEPSFAERLHSRATDRGALANLRKLLSQTPEKRCQGYLPLGKMGLAWAIGADQIAARTSAGLFGYHPKHEPKEGNFGRTCRKLAKATSEEAFERHFRRLLACKTCADACEVVARLGRIAKTKEIPINYDLLQRDLHFWSDGTRERWAKSYFDTRDLEASTDDLSE